MHPAREQLDELIHYFRQHAERAQLRRQIDEHLFLFGIEIGQRSRLAPEERGAYLKTFDVAMTLLVLDEITCKSRAEERAFGSAYIEATRDWLRNSGVIERWLERERKRCQLPDLSRSWRIDPETRRTLVKYLEDIATQWPEEFSYDQIDAFIDRLENPLDRA